MIHWELPKEKIPEEYYYVHGCQMALVDVASAYTFDVRCRLKIENARGDTLFSSLLEVTFVILTYDLSVDRLVERIKESTEIYLEEFDVKKPGTYLENLTPTWVDNPEWLQAAKECIERLSR